VVDRMKNERCPYPVVRLRRGRQPSVQAGDVPTLFNQSVSVFLRLQDEITALSGITKEARENWKKTY